MIYSRDNQWDCLSLFKHAGTVMLDFSALNELPEEFASLEQVTKKPAASIRRAF